MLTFYPWVKTLQSYRNLHGSLPRSWSELWEEEACSGFMDEVSHQIPDFFKRHRFLPQNVDIKIGNNSRIFAMGTGSLRPAPHVPETDPPKRMILVQTEMPKKELTISIVLESTLESIFENSGSKLSDFSGASGNWQPEPTLADLRLPKSENSRVYPERKNIRKALRNNPSQPQNGNTNSQKGFWWIVVGAAFFILIAMLWWQGFKKRQSRSG